MKQEPIDVSNYVIKNYALSSLAAIIKADWKKVYFGAVPYLDAMTCLESVDNMYGTDSGKSIVAYFLGNAGTWRGPVAKAVKAELNKRIKR